MTGQPWLGDACSLVDAFRAGTISPTEALEGSLDAIKASSMNAVCFVDEEAARAAAAEADVEPALRRRAHRRQGAGPGRGLAADRGVARLQGPGLGPRRHHDGAVAPGRRRARRPDDSVGVRRDQLHQHPSARGDDEPLRPRAHAGRVVRWFGLVDRRRTAAHLHRW